MFGVLLLRHAFPLSKKVEGFPRLPQLQNLSRYGILYYAEHIGGKKVAPWRNNAGF